METETHRQQLKALDMFGFRAAVPLFRADGEDGDHLATGTFVSVRGKLVLLTARHVLDEIEPEAIAIARSPEGSQLQTLGSLVVYTAKDASGVGLDIDIVGFEILDPETVQIAKDGWRVVDISIGDSALGTGEVLLVGYPSATLRKRGMQMTGRPHGIITKIMPGAPGDAVQPVDPVLDLFLHLSRQSIVEGGDIVGTPRIEGMSGCAIWELRQPAEGSLWSPERVFRLVGIQARARHYDYFRGKSWRYIEALLQQIS